MGTLMLGERCEAYCEHGGRCTKEAGHGAFHKADGSNNTPRCFFDESEAVTKAEADEVFRLKYRGMITDSLMDYILENS